MKVSLSLGVASLALLLASCGGSEGENAGNSVAAAGGAPTASVPAPNGSDWSQTVSQTAEGGFIMGNPNAPVKVVEFASYTCPHCAEFSEHGAQELVNKYVKTGQVSFELRNYVRDPIDLTVALLSRCGGAGPFFKLSDQLFAAQEDWIGKLQTMPAAMQQQLQTMQPTQMAQTVAEQAGLIQFVRVRGVPAEKAQQCLGDNSAIERLVQMNQSATQQYQLTGTPSFLINGEVVPNAANWATLEPKIQEAL